MMAYKRNPSRLPTTAKHIDGAAGFDADGHRVMVTAYEARGGYWMVYEREVDRVWSVHAEQQFTGKTAVARYKLEMDAARALLLASLPQLREDR